MNIAKEKLLIVTTSPLTINLILKDQPRYLSAFYDVELVTSPGATFGQISEREGVIAHALSMSRGINLVDDFLAILKMVVLVRKIKPSIIHSYTPKAGFVSMIAGFICRVPVRVHTFTGLIFPTQEGIKRLILKNVDRLICFCATRVIPESSGVKDLLIKENVTKKPLTLIGSGNIAGVNIDYFDPDLYVGETTASENYRFLFIGRLHRDKGIKELIHAFSKLDSKVELILVGDIDEEGLLDEEVLEKIESNPRINWVGFQHDIRPFLANANVLILPSYREGFPNVVLQAGAMALPCLVTNIPGSNEIIEQDKNGWIVPPKDHDALLSGIEKCLSLSKQELQAMGQLARGKIIEQFEQTSHWQRMNQFYQGLLKE